MIEMNRILTNINEDNLEEIILEEILPLDDTQLEKYVNELVAEMFSTKVWKLWKNLWKIKYLKKYR